MSRRNTLEAKKARRERKAITKGTLPAYIDLVEYVKTRVNVSTGAATSAILAGVLRIDSHKVGVEHTRSGTVLMRFVPAELRNQITVVVPDPLDA